MKKTFSVPASSVKPNQIVVFPDGREVKVISSLIDPADNDVMMFFGDSNFIYFQLNDSVKIVAKEKVGDTVQD